tara:strand:- start:5598 stop:6032 length:435 start_codon:yes stop_codon:yes gene_type:complete
MNLDKVQEEWQKDSELHRDLPELLANESLETSRLHSKYIAYYNQFRMMLTECETKLHKMKLEKWQYYSGKAPASVYKEKPFSLKVMKGDIGMYIDADDEYSRQRMKYQYLETCINSVERILKQIDNRGFAIKNAFDIIKYYGVT